MTNPFDISDIIKVNKKAADDANLKTLELLDARKPIAALFMRASGIVNSALVFEQSLINKILNIYHVRRYRN